MKQITFTVTNDLNYDQRMQRICSTLAHAGYSVKLVGRVLPDSKPLRKQPYTQHRLQCWFNKGKAFYVEYNIRLFIYLLFSRFDVVSSVDLDTIMPCYWVSKLKAKHRVLDAHEYFSEVPEVQGRPKVKHFWQRIERKYLPRFKHAYTVSQSIADEFKTLYGVDMQVVRNLPLEREVKAKQSDERFILYQGALNEGRGLEQLIGCMDKIEAPLKLAGEGDLSGQLRLLVEERGLTDKVEFLGRLSPENLWELTSQATIGLNLLENKGKSYYYSLANKCFDYIQAGIPNINMNFPEYKRLNDEFGVSVLIPDLREETIISATNQLLADQKLYVQLQANCRESRKVLNWQAEAPKLLDIYQSIG